MGRRRGFREVKTVATHGAALDVGVGGGRGAEGEEAVGGGVSPRGLDEEVHGGAVRGRGTEEGEVGRFGPGIVGFDAKLYVLAGDGVGGGAVAEVHGQEVEIGADGAGRDEGAVGPLDGGTPPGGRGGGEGPRGKVGGRCEQTKGRCQRLDGIEAATGG